MKRIALIAILALAASGITLVDKGRSAYSICVSAQASPSEQRAAQELQRFIEEMSGARLPIVDDSKPARGNLILLGDSAALRKLNAGVPFDKLGPEGFVLRTSGKHLIIAGGRQRGTMYGVYTFLDKLGCRWFTREVSRIPKRPTIDTGTLNETTRPAFEYREPFFTEAWDKDWAARNRTNGDHTQLDASTGGKLQYYPFVHSFYELLPPEKYFKDHPEYFSLIDGQRRTERGQLCLTNPDVLRIAIARVESWIKEHPDATIFSVSQNDWEGWCECDKCRHVEEEEGGQHSGPLLRFVNAVATDIGKRHPNKLIDTLAYWYTENPPLKVRPVRNVRIRLCPIGICVSHSFAQCPRSAYFYKNLQAWSKITKQLYIWHYNTNFRQYLLPFPDFDELAADILLYNQYGVVGLFMQGAYARGGGGENSELRAYVLARRLWDPSIDTGRAVDEFLEGVYGKAAKPMRQYFDLLHSEVRPPAGRHLWIFNVPDYSDTFRSQAKEIFARAEALAEDEATRRRVLKARLAPEYYELLRDSTYEVRDGEYAPAGLSALIPRALDLFARMRTFGIESLHEGQQMEKDQARYSEMKPLKVLTLENAAWRVDVVPALDARIVRMIDKATGRDALRQFPSGEGSYPAIGGQLVTAHADYHARAWDARWSLDSQTPVKLVLNGACDNGARLRRTLELRGPVVHSSTVLENTGSAPISAALQVRADFAPGDIDTATIAFRSVSGEQIEKKLVAAGEPPTGRDTWDGPKQPAGEWLLRNSAPGLALSTRFEPAEAGRSYFNWTAKSRPGVTFGTWSPVRTVAPGQSLKFDCRYEAGR
ncbi:MAG: DUF4838 domain-containing protein [Acidobacteria bacterium]|nr:DUF4838 domain-containing protein [Acidobacteriota bacterium]